ncbi:kinase-like domain-containing protein, partial [Mycena galericulata]
EGLDRYRAGGLHPVHLTEVYSSRYRILNKLGFGSSSHVWLAQDTKTVSRSVSRALALKFVIAGATDKTNEIEILRFLASLPPKGVGARNILTFLDTFQVEGPNGLHNVIVADAVASVFDLCKHKMIEDLNEVEIIRQIFQGVAFLHTHGVVHRDLHCGNIAIEFPYFRSSSVTELIGVSPPTLFPCVLCEPVAHPPSLPNYIVESTDVFCSDRYSLRREASLLVVKLVDFGCALRPGTSDVFPDSGPPRALTAPECLVAALHVPYPAPEDVWSFHSDIWTLGCSLVELYSRQPGQHPIFGGSLLPGAEMARLLGPAPEIYGCLLDDGVPLHHCDTHTSQPPNETFQDPGHVRGCESDDHEEASIAKNWLILEASLIVARAPRKPLSPVDEEVRVARDTKNVQNFLSLIKCMLRWKPEDRILADEALESPFLQQI